MIRSVASDEIIRRYSAGTEINSAFSLMDFVNRLGVYLKLGNTLNFCNQHIFVVPIVSLGGVLLFFFKKNVQKNKYIAYYVSLGCYIFNALICALMKNDIVSYFVQKYLPILGALEFERILVLSPIALFFNVYLLTEFAYEKKKYIAMSLILSIAMLSIIFGDGGLRYSMYNDVGRNIKISLGQKDERAITWVDYYSPELFERAKDDLDYNGEWSVAFGCSPAILTYNEIYTLDGYDSGMSRRYHDLFSDLISPYIQVGRGADYFTQYGLRAYIFSDDVSYELNYHDDKAAVMLMDGEKFREMSGKYVFSCVPIKNFKELGLIMLKRYDNSGGRKLYVYSSAKN